MGVSEPPPEPPRGEPRREREVIRERRPRLGPLIVEDFRSLRRWLALLGALAVLATAVAIYALLQNEDSADKGRVNQLERRLNDAQQRLQRTGEESDVNKLEKSTSRKAEESDIQKVSQQLTRLDQRLSRVEGDVADATDAAASTGRAVEQASQRSNNVNARVGELSDRLDALESSAGGN